MKEQQDKIWNDLSEESKSYILRKYNILEPERCEADRDTKLDYEYFFGTHNLNLKPQIKTWEDVEKEGYKIFDDYRGEDISSEYADYIELGNYCDCICLQGFNYDLDKERPDNKIILKAIATLKIAKLIELGYGGMMSEEEWKDDNIKKYCVIIDNGKIDKAFDMITIKQFIAFHTPEQREEFMSHESNRQLVKQYYMM